MLGKKVDVEAGFDIHLRSHRSLSGDSETGLVRP